MRVCSNKFAGTSETGSGTSTQVRTRMYEDFTADDQRTGRDRVWLSSIMRSLKIEEALADG